MHLYSVLIVDFMIVLAVSAIANIMRAVGLPGVPGSVVLRLGDVRVSIPLGAIVFVQVAIVALALLFRSTTPYLPYR
jgi:hypothetical protein